MAMPSQCFLSYAHHDHAGFDRLRIHLTPYAHLYGLKIWHDQRLIAGSYWNIRIQDEITRSQIFVLLTTNDFLSSDYILRHELPAILQRHRDAGALVLPVIYRECGWRGFFRDYIQVVPINDKGQMLTVRKWRDPEEALAVAAESISVAIGDWFGVVPRSPFAVLGAKR
jgi:hypothetical protein